MPTPLLPIFMQTGPTTTALRLGKKENKGKIVYF
jgi:hypothetical protein